MRKFHNYEAVQINNTEEAMEFLQYIEDNTDLEWNLLYYNPEELITSITNERITLPIFIEAANGKLWWERLESLLNTKTKIIPLTEFI